jgi:hypothetical protein
MAAALAGSLGVSTLAASPAAAAVVVTVDPATGLADGQPVTVTGSGFSSHASVGTAQCSAAVGSSHDTTDCDLSTSRTGSADAGGNASFGLRVKRVISTANGEVDCLTAANPCVIGMGDLSDLVGTSGGMAIAFDPNAPPLPPPSVSVSPNADLVDRQQVAVFASGFIPEEGVEVEQCVAGALDRCVPNQFGGGYGQADPTGSVAIGITVRRALLVDGQRVDCAAAAGTCVVTAHANGGPVGSAPLDFDGSTPLPPPPSVTITPSTGLADRQIVTVTGSGFPSNEVLFAAECEKGSSLYNGACSSSVYRQAETGADGRFTTTVRVRATLDSYDPNTGQPRTVNCVADPGTCIVSVVANSDATATASAPLVFDPAAPPVPPPSATVSPSTGLTDGQTVTVNAVGMPPGVQVVMVECKAGATDGSGCDLSTLPFVNVDDEGRVMSDFVVKRILSLNQVTPPPPVPQPITGRTPAAAASFFAAAPADASTFDCASAPGACTLSVAFIGSAIESAVVPLAFDPTVPPNTTVPGEPTTVPVDPGATTTTAVPPTAPGGAVNATSTSTTAAAPATTGGPLARTGSAISPLLQRVALLLCVGALALFASRQWRRGLAR